jgi:hypothetical protein
MALLECITTVACFFLFGCIFVTAADTGKCILASFPFADILLAGASNGNLAPLFAAVIGGTVGSDRTERLAKTAEPEAHRTTRRHGKGMELV